MEGATDVGQSPKGGKVSSDGTIPRVTADFPDGTPWWAKLGVKVITWIGFPAAVCAFLLWERGVVLKDFSKTIDTMTKVVERMAPILDKLERKVGP